MLPIVLTGGQQVGRHGGQQNAGHQEYQRMRKTGSRHGGTLALHALLAQADQLVAEVAPDGLGLAGRAARKEGHVGVGVHPADLQRVENAVAAGVSERLSAHAR